MNAVQSNKADKLNLLLQSGAVINHRDNRGFTALHRAAEMGHVEIVKILLANGADRSIEAESHTALSLAQAQNSVEIIELLS
jgi:ankyrin repeat protein